MSASRRAKTTDAITDVATGKVDPLFKLLDLTEVAELLCTSQRHIRRLVAERRIPFVKVGRFVRFAPADISVWISEHRIAANRTRGSEPTANFHPVDHFDPVGFIALSASGRSSRARRRAEGNIEGGHGGT